MIRSFDAGWLGRTYHARGDLTTAFELRWGAALRQTVDSERIEEGGVAAVTALDRALHERDKDVRTIVYNGGGGHFLFSRVDYWWDDLVAFLREKLA
jgi:hypothetical protein